MENDEIDFNDDNNNMMEFNNSINDVGVVKIGKTNFAIGLSWLPLEDGMNADKEARTKATEYGENADFYCIRISDISQIGFGYKKLHHKNGIPSLLAQLALEKNDNWIAVFEINNGYYLAAVDEVGAINAETDRFYTDINTAKEEFYSIAHSREWKSVIAPSSFDFPGSEEVNIEDIIIGKPKVFLKAVSRRAAMIRLLVSLLAVTGLVTGVMLYTKHNEEEALRLIQQAEELAASKLNFSKEEEIIIPPVPWENRPLASIFLDTCVSNINIFPQDIPGWEVDTLKCEAGIVGASLDRDISIEKGGMSSWIADMTNDMPVKVQIRPLGVGAFSFDSSKWSVTWEMGEMNKIPLDIETLPYRKVGDALARIFESRNTVIDLSAAPDNNDFYRGLKFAFVTEENPLIFKDVISAVPGLIMDNITYNLTSNKWRLEGRAYEQLPLPKKNN